MGPLNEVAQMNYPRIRFPVARIAIMVVATSVLGGGLYLWFASGPEERPARSSWRNKPVAPAAAADTESNPPPVAPVAYAAVSPPQASLTQAGEADAGAARSSDTRDEGSRSRHRCCNHSSKRSRNQLKGAALRLRFAR